MKNRMLRAAVLSSIVIAAIVGSVACSSGSGNDQLTLETYFEKLGEADDATSAEIDAIVENASQTEDLDEVKDAFTKLPPILEEFIHAIDDLNPPTEAQEAHNDAVAAGRDYITELNAMVAGIQDVDSIEQVLGASESEAFTAADKRFTDACLDLQTIADDADIGVSLECSD